MLKNIGFIAIIVLFFVSCKEQEKESSTTFESAIKPKALTSALLASGKLQRVDSFPSQYITPRPVDVWLPTGYSKDIKYSGSCFWKNIIGWY